MTGVYGHPELVHRSEVWILIFSLGRKIDKSWIFFGEFNEVLHVSEKWGDRAQSKKEMGV